MESSMLRYAAYAASLVMTLLSAWLMRDHPGWRWGLFVFAALALLGTWDLLQRKSTLRRNYPLLAHFRYGLESIGPEIRQYFIESDTEEVPFSRQQRALVYQRAKNAMDVVPFGTEHHVYDVAYELMKHSIVP
jgi:glutamate synthase domain-containing protein 2